MNRLEKFEYPLPILEASVSKIIIETSGFYEGSFTVKNTGGSLLSGKVTSNNKAIVFFLEEFEGNIVKINYALNLGNYNVGDEILALAVIMSNGGEKLIPMTIRVVPPTVTTKENTVLTNLESFRDYAVLYPLSARQLFNQKEFMIWLLNISYEHMEIYDYFVNDPNKERALENFFVFNGLKKKVTVWAKNRFTKVNVKPFSSEAVTGSLFFGKSGWGFCDITFNVKNEVNWLKLDKKTLQSSDFNDENVSELFFIILPDKLDLKNSDAEIELLSDGEIIETLFISACKMPALSCELSKNAFSFVDSGSVNLTNNTGGKINVDIEAKDGFVVIEAKKISIATSAKVPFIIKFTNLQLMQFSLKKQFSVTTSIRIKAADAKYGFSETIELKIGEFNG